MEKERTHTCNDLHQFVASYEEENLLVQLAYYHCQLFESLERALQALEARPTFIINDTYIERKTQFLVAREDHFIESHPGLPEGVRHLFRVAAQTTRACLVPLQRGGGDENRRPVGPIDMTAQILALGQLNLCARFIADNSMSWMQSLSRKFLSVELNRVWATAVLIWIHVRDMDALYAPDAQTRLGEIDPEDRTRYLTQDTWVVARQGFVLNLFDKCIVHFDLYTRARSVQILSELHREQAVRRAADAKNKRRSQGSSKKTFAPMPRRNASDRLARICFDRPGHLEILIYDVQAPMDPVVRTYDAMNNAPETQAYMARLIGQYEQRERHFFRLSPEILDHDDEEACAFTLQSSSSPPPLRQLASSHGCQACGLYTQLVEQSSGRLLCHYTCQIVRLNGMGAIDNGDL